MQEGTEDRLLNTNSWIMGLKHIIVSGIQGKLNIVVSTAKKIVSNKIADLSEEVCDVALQKSSEREICVFIDDVDESYAGDVVTARRISAMLSVIRKLVRKYKNLSFKVSIRIDAYYQYRKSDESTDKIQGYVTFLK